MKLYVTEMDEKRAVEILGWRYETPYDFYNNEDTAEDRAELLNGSYQAILDGNDKLVGFFCTGPSAQVPAGNEYGVYEADAIDMGLGMHPALTGKGGGVSFCTFILKEIEQRFPDVPVRLTVAVFNRRAIHLYEKLGFLKMKEFSSGTADFCVMAKGL